ncbi:MAG: carboxypeptidase regulatory-like domain-containing protein [Gemmatimonadota bacterium]
MTRRGRLLRRTVPRSPRPWLLPALVLFLVSSSGIALRASAQERHPLLDRLAQMEVTDVTIETALTELRSRTGIGLVYSPDLLPPDRRVSCECRDRTVREALEILLRDTGLTFTATATQVRIIPVRTAVGNPGKGSVAGLVVSDSDGTAIPNALVELGDGRGALTDEHGRFLLLNVPPGLYHLRVSGLGWDSQERPDLRVAAGETALVEFRLIRRVIPLSALVVSPGSYGILDEVRDYALQTLTRKEIETVPQLGEDVFRSLRRLPGVASGDISTRLYLRGGTDREVLMLLDGLELYEPYHLKDFDGALGIVDINAIGGIDLHAGGFPADYGNHMTGVFDMQTRAPPPEGVRTTLGLSITNASLLSQGHFGSGKGQWLLSARRGYMDIAFKLTDVNDDINPRYYDAFFKAQYQLGSRHLLSLDLLQAGDHLWLNTEEIGTDAGVGELETNWDNSYGWLTWKAYFTPSVRARTLASLGRVTRRRVGYWEEMGRATGPEAVDSRNLARFSFVGLKQDWTVDLTDRVAFRTGALVKRLFGDYNYDSWTRTLTADPAGDVVGVYDTTVVRMEPTGTEVGAYGSVRVRPFSWLTTEGGLRWDRFSHTGDSDLSPRLHALVDLGEGTTLRAGWGLYHQTQGIHELEAPDGETEFTPSERATQVALGLEHRFSGGISTRVEAYNRAIHRPRRFYLNLWREVLAFPELDADRRRIDPTEGLAKGLELMALREGETWDWTASYALSSTEQRIEGVWVPQFWDQTHAFSVTVGYRPNQAWNITASWEIHSGWPITPELYVVDTISVFQGDGTQWPMWWRGEFGTLNSIRLPAYHRLDLRVNRRFQLRRGVLDAYLDLFNAYNQENLRSYGYRLQTLNNHLVYVRYGDETLLPFLPSLGFRWEF